MSHTFSGNQRSNRGRKRGGSSSSNSTSGSSTRGSHDHGARGRGRGERVPNLDSSTHGHKSQKHRYQAKDNGKPKGNRKEQELYKSKQQELIVKATYHLLKEHHLLDKDDITFVDTHVHLEYILQNQHNQEQNRRLQLHKEFFSSTNDAYSRALVKKFDSCIAIFCDPASMSPSFGIWNELISSVPSQPLSSSSSTSSTSSSSLPESSLPPQTSQPLSSSSSSLPSSSLSSSSLSSQMRQDDISTSMGNLKIESSYRELHENWKIYCAFGLHPHSAKFYNDSLERRIIECFQSAGPNCVAYGEIGLDYHYNHSPPDVQRNVFENQIKLSLKIAQKKPIIIHTREAENDTFDILTKHVPKDYKMHIHCFTDSAEFAQKLLNHFSNVYFGFTGVITYSNAQKVRDVVKKTIPLKRIVLETDGPYMPMNLDSFISKFEPTNSPLNLYKGKSIRTTAHCGQLILLASFIADLKQIPLEHVLRETRQNTKDLYGI